MSKVEELQRQMKDLGEEIKNLQRQRSRVERDLAEELSGFHSGDIIEWDHGEQKRRGKVLRVRLWIAGGTDVTLVTNVINKKGEEYRRIEVHHWHHPRVLEPAE